YVRAHDTKDVDSIMALLAEDVRISMPPETPARGRAEARLFFSTLLATKEHPEWRLILGQANGVPAVFNYVRSSEDEPFQANSVDVLRIQDGVIVALHCFLGGRHVELFVGQEA
ncbi:nuclear transport factor 2 family protein, partial [Phycicoccus jejuensis]|uniref:nuclear transport factor 2 family protein n=1 Tax=Phycicoccus jejuensis TaxID=367299 RepID=UPI0004C2D2B6